MLQLRMNNVTEKRGGTLWRVRMYHRIPHLVMLTVKRSGKVIVDESDQHRNLTTSRGSPLGHAKYLVYVILLTDGQSHRVNTICSVYRRWLIKKIRSVLHATTGCTCNSQYIYSIVVIDKYYRRLVSLQQSHPHQTNVLGLLKWQPAQASMISNNIAQASAVIIGFPVVYSPLTRRFETVPARSMMLWIRAIIAPSLAGLSYSVSHPHVFGIVEHSHIGHYRNFKFYGTVFSRF